VMGGLLAMHASRPPLYHRDVKAANVGVTHGCLAKLLDCGVAKLVEAAPAGGAVANSTFFGGGALGTPGYTCPVYLQGGRAGFEYGPAQEVYSFGVLVLVVLSGLPAIGPDGLSLVDTFARRLGDASDSDSDSDGGGVETLQQVVAGAGVDWPADAAAQLHALALRCTHRRHNTTPRDL
jgi:hypothetical protein